MPLEPVDVGEAGEPAVVEGVPGAWRVDPAYLDGDFEGRTALLSPFDRLIHDRARALELFDFEYMLEMYKPAASAAGATSRCRSSTATGSSGSSTPPPTARPAVLRVNAVHEDVPFDDGIREGVQAELEDLAAWLGLELDQRARASARRTRLITRGSERPFTSTSVCPSRRSALTRSRSMNASARNASGLSKNPSAPSWRR